MSNPRVLFVSSEAHPLVKTGGLADVAGALPVALKALRCDVRIMIPAYKSALARIQSVMQDVKEIAVLDIEQADAPVRLLETRLPGSSVRVWLVDSPAHFDRDGGPYGPTGGGDWPDNAQRFALFSRVAVAVAQGEAGLDWQPTVVHCNDWQSGLVPALLSRRTPRPATVFTIHNLSYQGLFSWETFQSLALPQDLWSMHGMEYFGNFSFIKGGLVYSDMLSTVSPQYAKEITTPQFGYGLEELLRHRGDRLVGILNGADYRQWNPTRDAYIPYPYNTYNFADKQRNKTALQARMGLAQNASVPLLGMIGRLVEQKGFDLLLDALPELLRTHDLQLAVLGSGDPALEERLRAAARAHPGRVAAQFGYSEELAHQIEAGADIFVMPSRFEPCGLNQIYSLRYGTVPVVHRTGGLVNTVVDATPEALRAGVATGFVFNEPSPAALASALTRALASYASPRMWKLLTFQGMQQDFSWRRSAQQYLSLYRQAIQTCA
ncbi:MAG: glycogen synthase GlgA [Chromatiales bacterium]|jgi:starch synthase|nr:glycogen synthase GlgA [Chromatiales bacterium]